MLGKLKVTYGVYTFYTVYTLTKLFADDYLFCFFSFYSDNQVNVVLDVCI